MSVSPDVEELISNAKLMAHLATSVDDRPHVAPVWYAYDDGTLSLLTGGKKLANVQENPQVAVSIEKNTNGDAEWMATLLVREPYRQTPRASTRQRAMCSRNISVPTRRSGPNTTAKHFLTSHRVH
ncbi:pyridoxamine 5'-phosphate oxidase family protein [Halocatena marina]|uniref:Pyridoxamine 5'-phosphate oxidase family protein n=1 Tax=Halocatena marina TaxID=2934937 RepID=A0ABD5YNJ8_9EURY